MDIYVPDYYRSFSCLGGACQHNCCIGWEIDIDNESLARYQNSEGALGEKLRENIDLSGENAYFRLQKNGRCPFLNEENLCEIILAVGEEGLCQICRDHPRYRNFYSFGVEMGLGLCCEEAARLILSQVKPPRQVLLSGDGKKKPTEEEQRFFSLREEMIALAYSSEIPNWERPAAIYAKYGLRETEEDWPSVYTKLTHLNPDWTEGLWRLKQRPEKEMYAVFPQLFSYFLYRHFSGGLTDGRLSARLKFSIHAAEMILRMSPSPAAVYEIARQYAEEIEYAEENMEALLDRLSL